MYDYESYIEPPTRRERRRRETRAALLDAARTLFAAKGVHVTRVDEITDRVDLGKGAFYNYFDSKEDLVAALVTEGVDRLVADYLEPRRSPGITEVTARARAVVRAHDAFFLDHPDYVLLFHQARGLIGTARRRRTPLRTAFEAYVARVAVHLRRPGAATTSRRDLQLAAAVVGAIAGFRSFADAAGLEANAPLLAAILAYGIAGARRGRSATAARPRARR